MVALAHGTNDAQKTMGVICLALIANGNLSAENFAVPDWVVFSCGLAIACFFLWRANKASRVDPDSVYHDDFAEPVPERELAGVGA